MKMKVPMKTGGKKMMGKKPSPEEMNKHMAECEGKKELARR